jgi:uncharacterized protein (TIGR02453 family)
MNLESNIQFLSSLSQYNEKVWMDANKKWYEKEKQTFLGFVQTVINQLAEEEPALLGLNAKDCMFRINRDIRFSKDKSPYKTNFGAHISPEGKKSHKAGFYIHISPSNNSFIGGGIWMPEPKDLKKIRQEIDYNWEEFSNIISSPDFIDLFGDLSQEEKLSRPPKEYNRDNPAIEYLKLKSFTAARNITDKEIAHSDMAALSIQIYKTIQPLLRFLDRALD